MLLSKSLQTPSFDSMGFVILGTHVPLFSLHPFLAFSSSLFQNNKNPFLMLVLTGLKVLLGLNTEELMLNGLGIVALFSITCIIVF